jgi:hypothetical protein
LRLSLGRPPLDACADSGVQHLNRKNAFIFSASIAARHPCLAVVGEPTDNIFSIESFFHPSELLHFIPYDFEGE